ncbi:MAG: prepilin peptidase [Minisyncoccia bacterium]|jgi:leader peptidase (prepilin peptidase)/N-methyltransferase
MNTTLFSGVFIFILGTVIGSFLNVVIDRLDTERSAFEGRSFCPYCGKTLSWWEMVPVLNYIYLRGRCSSCHHRLPLQYPIIEALTGILFLSAYLRFLRFPLINNSIFYNLFYYFSHFNLETLFLILTFLIWLYWIFVLISIALYDLKKYLVASEILLPAIIISFIYKIIIGIVLHFNHFFLLEQTNYLLGSDTLLFGQYNYFLSLFLGIFFGFSLIASLAFFTKEKAMGWGDALIGILMGIILGFPNIIIALIITFLSGGFISFILIALNKKTMKSYLPFAPFLVLGTLSVLLFGDIIIKGYLLILLL